MPKLPTFRSSSSSTASGPAWLNQARTLAALIACGYAIIGALWIFYSDRILHALVTDPGLETQLQNVKGWFYVAVTAVLLWLVLNRYYREIGRSAEKIREREEQLRLVTDNIPNSYLYQYTRLADGSTRFDYVSAGVECVRGIPAEEALKDPGLLFAQCTPDELAMRKAAEIESARSLKEFRIDMHIRRADGQNRVVSMRSQPRRVREGSTQWNGFAVDITESIDSARALAESERHYRELVRTANSAIIRWRRDGSITFFNEWAQNFFGYTAEEVLGQSISILVPDRESTGRDLLDLVSNIVHHPERFVNNVNENVCKDGRRVWIAWTNTPVLDETGQLEEILCIGTDITARVHAEEHLRASERKLRLISENTNDLVFAYDMDRRLVYVNSAIEKMTGYSLKELEERKFINWLHPEDAPRMMALLDGVFDGRGFTGEEFRIVTKDGRLKWSLSSWSPMRDEEGRQVGVQGCEVDITERKRAEEVLRRQDNLLREMGRVAQVGGWEFDPATGKGTWTEEVARIHDLDPSDETCLEKGLSYYHGESRERIERAVREAVESGTPYDLELELVTAQGARKWVRTIGTPRVENGKLVRVGGSFQDITKLKASQEAVQISELRLRTLFNEASEGIALADAETGVILDCNQALCNLTGYAREELIGSTQAMLHPPESTQSSLSKTFQRHLTDLHGSAIRTELLTRSGEVRQVRIKASVINIEGRPVLQGFFLDVTEEMRLDRERETTVSLLRLFNERNDLRELARGATAVLREWSGCDAVGACLRDGSGFTYFETCGSPSEFLEGPRQFCEFAPHDDALGDHDGDPLLACVCGNILSGRIDPTKPYFTANGSFWSNSASALLERLSENDRQVRIRRGCQGFQYESVAVIPIRSDDHTQGLLYFYGGGKDRFTPAMIAHLENTANQFAIALAQRQAKRLLVESEERYRALVESAPDAILVFGREGILYANAVAIDMCGFSTLEEILLKDPLELIHPDDREVIAGRMQLGLDGAILPARESRLIRPDGTEVNVETSGRPVNLEGQPGVQIFGRDITARKRAEDELRKLSAVVTQSPVSVVITDLSGRIEYVNPKFTEVTGYTFEEVQGMNPRVLKSDDSRPESYQTLWQTIMAGGEWQGEFHNRKKDGSLYWERAVIAPIRDGDAKITHFVAVKEDITHQKSLEDQFRQAQKMEAIGQLAGGVAHDFNNILQAIMGFGQMALDEIPAQARTHEFIDEILVGAQRAAALTRQLLAFSRRQVLEMRVININDVVGNLLKMVQRVIGENIELHITPGQGLWAVRADVGQIEQVLVNLCVNARDSMPQGGKLTIRSRNVLLDNAYAAEHDWAAPGAYVLLSVSDTGHGMCAETAQRVFEPFFTTKGVGKGSGLGLATVYGIVQQHGGMIRLHSEVGEGTEFSIYLPAVKAESVSRMVSETVSSQGGTETLLVAEDNEPVRKAVVIFLEKAGYTVLAAEDGHKAIELFKHTTGQQGRKIELIISDVVMPKLGGRGILEHLKDDPLCPRFLFTSGYSTEAVSDFVAGEDTPLLQKPYKAADLLRKVREVLDTPRDNEKTS